MLRIALLSLFAITLSAWTPTPVAPAAIQIVSGDNQSAIVTTGFAQPLTVRVVDENGVGVPGVEVTFQIGGQGSATALFQVGSSPTDVATTNELGFVTSSPFAANNWVGGYSITVTVKRHCDEPLIETVKAFNGPWALTRAVPESLFFNMLFGDSAPPAQTVTISSPTNGFEATADSPWIKIKEIGHLLLEVTADPTGLAAGSYDGYVTINGQAVVRVRLTITLKPILTSTVKNLSFTYKEGDGQMPARQFFSVASSLRNMNIEVNVKYNSPETGNWLFVAAMRGMTTPISLQAVCDSRGMKPGTYQAEIDISSSGATNSPLVIPVTLVVSNYSPSLRSITLISNAASGLPGAVSVDELVRIGGTRLDCASGPSVLMGSEPAEVVRASANEIYALVPRNLSQDGRIAVQVACEDSASGAFEVPISYASPGVFTVSASQALAHNEDLATNGSAAPAAPGSVITLYGTGFGSRATTPLAVNIGGQAAALLSETPLAKSPGVTQLKVRVPHNVAGGPAAVEILAGLESAQAGPAIVVQ